jgi:hypothetical protein
MKVLVVEQKLSFRFQITVRRENYTVVLISRPRLNGEERGHGGGLLSIRKFELRLTGMPGNNSADRYFVR